MDILRFITAGNVDDGKSTLIGRLLYDTNNIKDDILHSIGNNTPEMNLAHITDGLRAERQQGITIDVAYKYFFTPNRKYIIIDAPGHFQYTKNLVTGASNVDVIIILIDAINGITEQTRRHSLVASFLKISHVVVAVNKMDAIGYNEYIFESIKEQYQKISEKLQLQNIIFIPISALVGDNVSVHSQIMNWYKGITLLKYLETISLSIAQHKQVRFSVQCNVTSGINNHEIGNAGKLLSGKLKKGDSVVVFPEENVCRIDKIIHGYIEVPEAFEGQNVTVYLEGNKELDRGSIIADFQNKPSNKNRIYATIGWLDSNLSLVKGDEYIIRINTAETRCIITEILYLIDNNSFDKYSDTELRVNQFAKVEIGTFNYIAFDSFSVIQECGRGIIIDPKTNNTSGVFIID